MKTLLIALLLALHPGHCELPDFRQPAKPDPPVDSPEFKGPNLGSGIYIIIGVVDTRRAAGHLVSRARDNRIPAVREGWQGKWVVYINSVYTSRKKAERDMEGKVKPVFRGAHIYDSTETL